MNYIINYFKLAGRAKGLLANRVEYLVGFAIFIFSDLLLTFIEIASLYLAAILNVIFVIPFIALLMRRLQDININRFFGLIIIPIIFINNLLEIVSTNYILFLLIFFAILPSAKNNKYVNIDTLKENTNKKYELRDNPIIGFKPKRFFKILLLFLILPILFLIGLIFLFS